MTARKSTYQPEPQWNPVNESTKEEETKKSAKKRTLSELSEQGYHIKKLAEKESHESAKKKKKLRRKEEEEEEDDYQDYGEDVEEDHLLGQFSNLESFLSKSEEVVKRHPIPQALKERMKEMIRAKTAMDTEKQAMESERVALVEKKRTFKASVEKMKATLSTGVVDRCYKEELALYTEKKKNLITLLGQRLLGEGTKKIRQRLIKEKRCELPEEKLRLLIDHLRLGCLLSTHFPTIYYGELDGFLILVCHCAERPDDSPYIMLRSDRLKDV